MIIQIIPEFFQFSSNIESSRNEFKMYSTTKHGLVHLSNIKVPKKQHSKYLWRIHSKPILTEEHLNNQNNIPNCATMSTKFSSVDTTIRMAAYFALFGLLGFSVVWLFLILCLIYGH